MKKIIRYQLTYLHKLLMGILLLLGFVFLFGNHAYRSVLENNGAEHFLSFLQKGEYVLNVTYENSPADNAVVVYAPGFTGQDNVQGGPIVQKEIPGVSGIMQVPLELSEGVYGLRVKSLLDDSVSSCVRAVELQSVQLQNTDGFLLAGLCFTGVFLILCLGLFVPVEKYGDAAVLTGLGLLASLPLFNDFLFGADDMRYHLARIEGISQAMAAGEFPVRINPVQTFGYGSLLATMYPQLFLYPAALLRLGRVSLMLCYKLLLAAVNIGSAFSAFYSVKPICKSKRIAYAAGILYTFSLYRLNNMYFRGAVGEALAMVFLPLVIWGAYEVLWGDRKKWPVLMLGMTGVLQSHLISTELCVLFLIIEVLYWFAKGADKNAGRRVFAGLCGAAGAILLNASFLLPFLFFSGQDLQSFHMPNEVPSSAVYFSQMFASFMMPEGSSLERGTTQGEMPLTVGLILLAGAVCFCAAASKQKQKTVEIQLGKHCLAYGLLSLFMASWLFPWDKLVKLEFFNKISASLQFAWRFLGPASIFLCIAGAVGFVYLAENGIRGILYGASAAVIFCSAAYFFDMRSFSSSAVSDKMQVESYNDSDSMYMYTDSTEFRAIHLDYAQRDSDVKAAGGSVFIYSGYEKKGSGIRLHVKPVEGRVVENDYLMFPLYYYPGYEILINNEPVETLSFVSQVACPAPREEADIQVRYVGMPWFLAGDVITLLTILGFAGWRLFFICRDKKHVCFKTAGISDT